MPTHDEGCDRDHHPDAVCNPETDEIGRTLGEPVDGPTGRRERRIVISDGPNPLACPTCGKVGGWVADPNDPNRALCGDDGTHIFTKRPDVEHPTIEGAFRIDLARGSNDG